MLSLKVGHTQNSKPKSVEQLRARCRRIVAKLQQLECNQHNEERSGKEEQVVLSANETGMKSNDQYIAKTTQSCPSSSVAYTQALGLGIAIYLYMKQKQQMMQIKTNQKTKGNLNPSRCYPLSQIQFIGNVFNDWKKLEHYKQSQYMIGQGLVSDTLHNDCQQDQSSLTAAQHKPQDHQQLMKVMPCQLNINNSKGKSVNANLNRHFDNKKQRKLLKRQQKQKQTKQADEQKKQEQYKKKGMQKQTNDPDNHNSQLFKNQPISQDQANKDDILPVAEKPINNICNTLLQKYVPMPNSYEISYVSVSSSSQASQSEYDDNTPKSYKLINPRSGYESGNKLSKVVLDGNRNHSGTTGAYVG